MKAQILHKKFYPALCLCLFLISANSILAQDKLKVLASASMFADMASNIGGDKVSIKTIVPIGGDPHLHETTPRDAIKVSEADVILVNGLTFEGWITELIANAGSDADVKLITEGVTPISSTVYKNASDPHAWMNAENGLIYAKNIFDALSKNDPTNEEYYKTNYLAYKKELEDLDSYIKLAIESIPRDQRVLITSHDAFSYYGKRYGLRLEAIMGISTEADAQTSDIIRVTEVIEKYNVPAVFIESTINPKLIKRVAEDNNVAIGGELYADSLGPKGSEGESYLKMLKHNTDVIVSALRNKNMSKTQHDDADTGNPLWSYLAIIGILALGFLAVLFKLNN